MKLLLDELQLKYVIHNEVLLITSPAKAESDEYMTTKVYPVADLVLPIKETGFTGGFGGLGGQHNGLGSGIMSNNPLSMSNNNPFGNNNQPGNNNQNGNSLWNVPHRNPPSRQLRTSVEISVAFRSAKDAAFAERKATMRQLLIRRPNPHFSR